MDAFQRKYGFILSILSKLEGELEMKLQIAVDLADTKRILGIADQIHDVIDIYEVGIPVIMKEGIIHNFVFCLE